MNYCQISKKQRPYISNDALDKYRHHLTKTVTGIFVSIKTEECIVYIQRSLFIHAQNKIIAK